MSGDVFERALRWASGGDTGLSSMMIVKVMTGQKPDSRRAYPHDGGDFGRCYRLLECVPEWRERLEEMRQVGPEWSALVDIWPELEALHAAGMPGKVYEAIRRTVRPIEDRRYFGARP